MLNKNYDYNKNVTNGKHLSILLILISIFFLFYNLSGDKSILKGGNDYADEGYWVQNPINKIRHGTFLLDDQSQSFFGSPLYNQLLTFQFNLFGISFFNARIISIIFLILNAVVLYFILIPHIKIKSHIFLYLGGFLLLFDNKIYYQWATPVPVEIFFQSLIILFLINYKIDSYKSAIILIFLIYLCILSKTTSIWLIILFLIVIMYDYINIYNISFNKKLIFNFLIYSLISIIPFLLLNYYFAKIEPEKYKSYIILLKNNAPIHKIIYLFNNNFNLLLNKFLQLLNPLYYLQSFLQIFKFPNSLFLIIMPILTIMLICESFFKNKIILLLKNRVHTILFFYVLAFITFLILIGQFGYDRREINLIVPFYIISVLIYDKFLYKEIKLKYILFICLLFILISILQLRTLWEYSYFDKLNIFTKNTKLIIILILILYFLISIYLIYKFKLRFLFMNFLFINIIFHFYFINNDHTLLDMNKKVKKISEKYNVKYITGIKAHHLSIESGLIPIWWLDKSQGYPDWNYNFPLFSKSNPTIIITDLNLNTTSGYLPLKKIPSNYKIIETDTIFLYRNKYTNTYMDSLILHVVK